MTWSFAAGYALIIFGAGILGGIGLAWGAVDHRAPPRTPKKARDEDEE